MNSELEQKLIELSEELREIYRIAKEKRQDYMAKMLEEGRLDAMYNLPSKNSGFIIS